MRKSIKNENEIITVERHPRGRFSLWPFILLAVAYGVFKYLPVLDKGLDLDSLLSNLPFIESQESLNSAPNLHQLVSQARLKTLKDYVLKVDGTTVNEVKNGMTPIMIAASIGNVEIIDLLFAQGADPNKRGSMERTALLYATEKNHVDAAQRLLAYGADIDANDNGKLTPLIMAASRGYTELGLMYIKKGANVNSQHSQGWTALIDAAAHNDEKLVNALLSAGADKELVANNGLKAIDYARQYGFKNMVKILSE